MDEDQMTAQQAAFRATVLAKLTSLEETTERIINHMESIFKRLGQGDVVFSTVEDHSHKLVVLQQQVDRLDRNCVECQARRKVTWAMITFLIMAMLSLGTLLGHYFK